MSIITTVRNFQQLINDWMVGSFRYNGYRISIFSHVNSIICFTRMYPFFRIHNSWVRHLVLCQDLVQVKMRKFPHFNPPEAQPQCVFFHTLVRIRLATYSCNGYEFVSYCRKLPDIRKSNDMPACNREF